MFSGGLKLTDEDDDFNCDRENGRSNLSSIFGIAGTDIKQKNVPSLQYTPPKQSKVENVSQDDTTNEWKVQVAKVVTAYKLLNQENLSQGKVGIAVLKSTENQYRIILYRSKTNVISNTQLKENATIFRNGLYLQFSDDLQIFWSVLFETEDIEAVLAALEGRVYIQINQQKPDIPSTAEINSNNVEEQQENNSSDDRVKETKASILSRMAKMGQPLPKLATTVTTSDVSDSSDMEMKKTIQKPTIPSRKPKAQSLVPVSSTQQIVPSVSSGLLYQPLYPQDTQCMNVLFAENRTQNTEVRMNLCKLETKIDRVLDKIENISGYSSKDQKEENKDDEILELEEKLLEMKKQNRTLKLQMREIEQRHVSIKDNRNMSTDVQEFAHLIEQFNINPKAYTTSSDLCKDIISHLEDCTASLNSRILLLESSSQNSTEKLDKVETEYKSLQHSLEEQKIESERLQQNLQTEIDGFKAENDKLIHELKQQSTSSRPSVESLILEIMNNLYQRLSLQFDEKDTYSAAEANQIIASAIKQETKSVIRRNDKIKKSSDK